MNWLKFLEEYRQIHKWLEGAGSSDVGHDIAAILSAVLRSGDGAESVLQQVFPQLAEGNVPEEVFYIVNRWQFSIPKDSGILGEIHQRTSSGRKAQGLYYTPAEIVDFILRHTIAGYDLAANPYVKILDPACGCGYFLLRAYDHLWEGYCKARPELVERYPNADWSDDGIHKHIINMNLWGADIDAAAINFAKTGLFLKRKSSEKGLKPNLLVCDSLKDVKELDLLSEGRYFWSSKYDFVIGNPPYLSFGLRGVGRMDAEYADYLRKVYKETAEYKISYYALFMQRGIDMLNDGGKLGFIVPDSFLLGRYFSKIRRYILENTVINLIAHITSPVFKSATVGRSAICILTKETDPDKRNSQIISVYKSASADSLAKVTPVSSLEQNYYNSISYNRLRLFFDSIAKKLVDKIEAAGIPLGAFSSGHTGIRSLSKQSEIISSSCQGPSWQQGLISGRQVSRYGIDYQGHWLNINAGVLYSGGWRKDVIGQRKILLRQTGYSLIAAIDEKGYYHLNNLHSFILNSDQVTLDYLLMLLNSRLMAFYYHVTSMEYGRAMAQTDIETIELLPVKVNADISKQAPGLVQSISDMYTRGRSDKQAEYKAHALDEYFNQLFYRIYGLTEAEISYIETYEEKS